MMHYIAFLIVWMVQPDPTYNPKAAFVQKFDTYKECKDFQRSISDPEIKKVSECLLLVAEPKEGIAE